MEVAPPPISGSPSNSLNMDQPGSSRKAHRAHHHLHVKSFMQKLGLNTPTKALAFVLAITTSMLLIVVKGLNYLKFQVVTQVNGWFHFRTGSVTMKDLILIIADLSVDTVFPWIWAVGALSLVFLALVLLISLNVKIVCSRCGYTAFDRFLDETATVGKFSLADLLMWDFEPVSNEQVPGPHLVQSGKKGVTGEIDLANHQADHVDHEHYQEDLQESCPDYLVDPDQVPSAPRSPLWDGTYWDWNKVPDGCEVELDKNLKPYASLTPDRQRPDPASLKTFPLGKKIPAFIGGHLRTVCRTGLIEALIDNELVEFNLRRDRASDKLTHVMIGELDGSARNEFTISIPPLSIINQGADDNEYNWTDQDSDDEDYTSIKQSFPTDPPRSRRKAMRNTVAECKHQLEALEASLELLRWEPAKNGEGYPIDHEKLHAAQQALAEAYTGDVDQLHQMVAQRKVFLAATGEED
ncbi:hypothetical protein MMC10_002110 [Thelotrema lepadinum]|nr:hypothetical protein [Thelotrema lepadinum]